jgi:hypothetical protein
VRDNRTRAVQILGAGAAALAVARGFAHHGIEASVAIGPTRPGPELLLNWATLELLHDLFGCKAALLREGSVTRGRLVSWAAVNPELVVEPGLIVSANSLYQILFNALKSCEGSYLVQFTEAPHLGFNTHAMWTVDARGRGAGNPGKLMVIGERTAICSKARLSTQADSSLSAVEATEHGWLFLLPRGGKRAVVQAVVPQSSECADDNLGMLLAESKLINQFVAALDGEPYVLPSAPQFRPELARPGWVAAGDAALCFDPLCGDGTGQALRSGLLAAAVIEAIERGQPEEACLLHYLYRLRRAMRAHLKATILFYENAPSENTWRREIEKANQALGRIAHDELDRNTQGGSRYRLECFSLVRASER